MSLLHDISGVSTCRGIAGQVCVEQGARACEFSKPAVFAAVGASASLSGLVNLSNLFLQIQLPRNACPVDLFPRRIPVHGCDKRELAVGKGGKRWLLLLFRSTIHVCSVLL